MRVLAIVLKISLRKESGVGNLGIPHLHQIKKKVQREISLHKSHEVKFPPCLPCNQCLCVQMSKWLPMNIFMSFVSMCVLKSLHLFKCTYFDKCLYHVHIHKDIEKENVISVYSHKHTRIYIYIYIYTNTHTLMNICI